MAYQKTTPKYTAAQTQEWSVRAMVVLSESQKPLSCDEIRQSDLCLVGVTPQKMARILTELVESGFVVKTKSKSKGVMLYMSVGVLIEQGYNLEEMVY